MVKIPSSWHIVPSGLRYLDPATAQPASLPRAACNRAAAVLSQLHSNPLPTPHLASHPQFRFPAYGHTRPCLLPPPPILIPLDMSIYGYRETSHARQSSAICQGRSLIVLSSRIQSSTLAKASKSLTSVEVPFPSSSLVKPLRRNAKGKVSTGRRTRPGQGFTSPRVQVRRPDFALCKEEQEKEEWRGRPVSPRWRVIQQGDGGVSPVQSLLVRPRCRTEKGRRMALCWRRRSVASANTVSSSETKRPAANPQKQKETHGPLLLFCRAERKLRCARGSHAAPKKRIAQTNLASLRRAILGRASCHA